MGRTGIEPVTP